MRSQFFKRLLLNKQGTYNLKSILAIVFVLVILSSWIAAQFFGFQVPEFIFKAFVELLENTLNEY